MRARPFLPILLAVGLLSSCVSNGHLESPSGSEAESEGAEYPLGFFTDPFQGMGAKDPHHALSGLTWEPVEPSGTKLGKLTGLHVLDQGDAAASAVAWTYDGADGPFMIVENPDDMTQRGLEAEGSPVPNPGCTEKDSPEGPITSCIYGGFSVVELSWGKNALLIDGQSVVSVTWLTKLIPSDVAEQSMKGFNLEIRVMGPAETFTTQEALDVVGAAFDGS